MKGEWALLSVLIVQIFGVATLIFKSMWDFHVEKERRKWEIEKENRTRLHTDNAKEEIMAGVQVNTDIAAKTLKIAAHSQGKTVDEVLGEANSDLDSLMNRYLDNAKEKARTKRRNDRGNS
jgi:hypothetical protein